MIETRKILHVIAGLSGGGAEALLFNLCAFDTENEHIVVSLSNEGKYGPLLCDKGVTVYTLGMTPGRPSVTSFVSLVRLLKKHRPDVVQTWMYHADLLGGIAARMIGIRSIVWGIHATNLEIGQVKKTTVWISALLAKLSWWVPSHIAVCARSAIDVHETMGYSRSKMRFVPNGYDTSHFTPKLSEAKNLKVELGIDDDIPLIGSVGRYHPTKDYDSLLRALSLLKCWDIPIRCLLVGTNLDHRNKELLSKVEKLGLEHIVILLGVRTDIPVVMTALDLHVLPSISEAFPNVICEAMACGTPCLATDVGDAAHIISNTGWVVPTKNPAVMAKGIQSALEFLKDAYNKVEISEKARSRINENFNFTSMKELYSNLWKDSMFGL